MPFSRRRRGGTFENPAKIAENGVKSRRSSAAERGIRNAQVRGSNPRAGSIDFSTRYRSEINSTSIVLVSKIATVGFPVSQPQTSPGLTIKQLLLAFRMSALWVCP